MMYALKDARTLSAALARYARTGAFRVWASFALSAAVLFWLFSSGEFSFILTLSSLVSTFSFLVVVMQIEGGGGVAGVSLRMAECYVAVFAGRLCAIVPFEGYLPFDRSGDWLYQASEACALCLAGWVVHCCRARYVRTYNAAADTMNHLWFMVPALAAALIFHPSLNEHTPSDIAWAFALYLESVAVLCQFHMFMREGKAQAHTAHFLAAQALAKMMSFVFWAASVRQLSDGRNAYAKVLVGPCVVAMQIIQLLVMVDFIFNYVECIWCGVSVSKVIRGADIV